MRGLTTTRRIRRPWARGDGRCLAPGATEGAVLVVGHGPPESIRLVLEQRFRVITVESAEKVIDVSRRHRVDVVTLDLTMTDLSGIEAFRQIQETASDVAIIVVSSVDPGEVRLRATDWIAEPFAAAARLLDAVERAAEQR